LRIAWSGERVLARRVWRGVRPLRLEEALFEAILAGGQANRPRGI
jgi:hypothetical protein